MTKRMMYVQRQEKLLDVLCRIEGALQEAYGYPPLLQFTPARVSHYSGMANSTYLRNHLIDLCERGLIARCLEADGSPVSPVTYVLTEKGRMLNEALADLYVRIRD